MSLKGFYRSAVLSTAVVILGARSIASQVGLSAFSFIYQYLLEDNDAGMTCV